jgi:transposase
MIQITPQMRILVAVEAVDFRQGIDGLSRVCRQVIKSDPFSGYVFVFRNRRRTAIKVLMYDGQGFWLCCKRLSEGRFRWWPDKSSDKSLDKSLDNSSDKSSDKSNETVCSLAAHDLQLLIWNGNPESAKVAPMWKQVQLSG